MAGNTNYNPLLFPLTLSLAILTLSTFFYLLHRRLHSAVKPPKLIGLLLNRHRYHDWITDMLATSPSLTLKLTGGICTADPTNVEHFSVLKYFGYIKRRRYTSVLHPLLGTGILNSNGNLWSLQRRIATPIFKTESLEAFVSKTVQLQVSKSLIPYLLTTGNRTVDLQQVLRKFCFDNICNVVIGVNPGLLTSNSKVSKYSLFVQAFDTALEHTSKQIMSPFPTISKLKTIFNIWNERKYKEAIATVNQFAMDAVKSRETQDSDEINGDLLSRFAVLTYNMERDDNSRREFLRDIIISFIFAGKDLTSTALTWFFWLLDGHPRCKRLIRKELSTLKLSLNRPLNLAFDDLKSLNYLHAALSESMRLFPPVPVISKSALDDDVLPDGTFVQEGWFVDCSVYAMGRMERIWGSDCREFKPERWLDGNGVYKRLDPFKYPVFSCGYRSCLGREMVYFQMKLVVVAVMREFEIEVVGGGGMPEKVVDPPYRVATVLGMKKGLHVRLKKREQTQQQSIVTRVKDGGVIMALFGLFLVGLSFYKHKLYKSKG